MRRCVTAGLKSTQRHARRRPGTLSLKQDRVAAVARSLLISLICDQHSLSSDISSEAEVRARDALWVPAIPSGSTLIDAGPESTKSHAFPLRNLSLGAGRSGELKGRNYNLGGVLEGFSKTRLPRVWMRMCTITGVDCITRVYNKQLVSRKTNAVMYAPGWLQGSHRQRVNLSPETCVIELHACIDTLHEANTPMACAAIAAELETLS